MNCSRSSICIHIIPQAAAWRATALLFFLPLCLAAQTFDVETSSKEVVLGSSFELSFTLKDAQATRFIAPDLGDFKVLGGPRKCAA
ncbi:MAG: hypothetical protein IPJ82_21615 [Lewinellaceae bacterium]|nr:hypothetical protein [Lewinellaceae bacterium]